MRSEESKVDHWQKSTSTPSLAGTALLDIEPPAEGDGLPPPAQMQIR